MAALFSQIAMAQGNEIEMADLFRSEGKIYVVVAVMLIIFAGLALYIISLDRRIKKMEEESKKH